MNFCALVSLVLVLINAYCRVESLVLEILPILPSEIDDGTANTGSPQSGSPFFNVLSILPSRTDGRRQRLEGNAPLTVVFSLPVIRLGTYLLFVSRGIRFCAYRIS